MENPTYSSFVDSLTTRGWQVVQFDLPNKKAISDYWIDGGLAYSQAYLSKLTQVIVWTEQMFGHSDDYSIGGISHGGLHAIIGAQRLKLFKKFFAVVPVTKLNILSEFSSYTDVPFFDPTVDYKSLSYAKGYLSWNTTDDRVGYTETEKLFYNLKATGATIDSTVYRTGGHTIIGNLDPVLRFLQK